MKYGFKTFNGPSLIRLVFQFGSVITFIATVIYCHISTIPYSVSVFMIFFTALTVVISFLFANHTTLRYLFSTFTLLIAWRIGILYNIPDWLTILFGILFLSKISYFITIAYLDITSTRPLDKYLPAHYISTNEWQLLFVRLYVGYDLVPHFTEKLFAANIRLGDVDSFSQLGISHPLFFVLVAGVIELLGSLSLIFGILTSAGSILLFIYLVVTAFLGHHFSDGFIWASPGGGWEYPVLWSVLVLTFAFFAPYKFSVDQFLLNHYNLPQWLVYFIGKRRKTF